MLLVMSTYRAEIKPWATPFGVLFFSFIKKNTDFRLCVFLMVEMRRIELLSENIFTPASTSVDCVI